MRRAARLRGMSVASAHQRGRHTLSPPPTPDPPLRISSAGHRSRAGNNKRRGPDEEGRHRKGPFGSFLMQRGGDAARRRSQPHIDQRVTLSPRDDASPRVFMHIYNSHPPPETLAHCCSSPAIRCKNMDQWRAAGVPGGEAAVTRQSERHLKPAYINSEGLRVPAAERLQ